mgnify:CR=1 FL=1
MELSVNVMDAASLARDSIFKKDDILTILYSIILKEWNEKERFERIYDICCAIVWKKMDGLKFPTHGGTARSVSSRYSGVMLVYCCRLSSAILLIDPPGLLGPTRRLWRV